MSVYHSGQLLFSEGALRPPLLNDTVMSTQKQQLTSIAARLGSTDFVLAVGLGGFMDGEVKLSNSKEYPFVDAA